MKKLYLPPHAPSLIESIRAIGYTFESAIADIIDNSITAGATAINIRFTPYGIPYVAILDNGHGMNPETLTRAMRHGSSNPSDPRPANDLGRFGLGLKTASLSQCRRLTVVSLRDGNLSARCWDLDIILDDRDWTLLELEPEEIRGMPLVSRLECQESGTVVIWEYLDRVASGESSIEKALGEKMDQAREHLSLVFHRFLGNEPGHRKLIMDINENPVEPADPYLSANKATEALPDETVHVEGYPIRIKPFILPHISKLSSVELALAGGEEGLRKKQGFYIYRNRRLIIWGTWFRLIRQEEMTKLARVRVDIPNALDHLWTLDVKKSAAYPPEAVRQNLRRIVERIGDSSKRVYKFRGRKTNSGELIHLWDRIQGREGIAYQINRSHPVIKALSAKLDQEEDNLLRLILRTLETTFPADSLYADMASDGRITDDDAQIRDTLRELATHLIAAADAIEGGKKRLITGLHMIDPFCLYPEITNEIVREYGNGE